MYLRKKLADIQIPLEVRCLEDRIQRWEETKYGLLIYPKERNFARLVISTKGIGGFEVAHVFLSIIDIVSEGKMTEKQQNLSRVLKSYECELSMKGILGRNPTFKSAHTLLSLQRHAPELQPNPELATMLNSDEAVMRIVKETKPDELKITLSSTFEHYGQSSRELSEVRFYDDPTSISWICLLTKYMPKGRSFKKDICKIYDLLDMTALLVLKLTETLIAQEMH